MADAQIFDIKTFDLKKHFADMNAGGEWKFDADGDGRLCFINNDSTTVRLDSGHGGPDYRSIEWTRLPIYAKLAFYLIGTGDRWVRVSHFSSGEYYKSGAKKNAASIRAHFCDPAPFAYDRLFTWTPPSAKQFLEILAATKMLDGIEFSEYKYADNQKSDKDMELCHSTLELSFFQGVLMRADAEIFESNKYGKSVKRPRLSRNLEKQFAGGQNIKTALNAKAIRNGNIAIR